MCVIELVYKKLCINFKKYGIICMDMWEKTDKLTKEFTFKDFNEALAFVNKVGELADKADHHPDIELSWGKVVVNLVTHSEGKITEKDYALAEQIDQL